jgi:hypothetical protein
MPIPFPVNPFGSPSRFPQFGPCFENIELSKHVLAKIPGRASTIRSIPVVQLPQGTDEPRVLLKWGGRVGFELGLEKLRELGLIEEPKAHGPVCEGPPGPAHGIGLDPWVRKLGVDPNNKENVLVEFGVNFTIFNR